jgi:hypothetical protein
MQRCIRFLAFSLPLYCLVFLSVYFDNVTANTYRLGKAPLFHTWQLATWALDGFLYSWPLFFLFGTKKWSNIFWAALIFGSLKALSFIYSVKTSIDSTPTIPKIYLGFDLSNHYGQVTVFALAMTAAWGCFGFLIYAFSCVCSKGFITKKTKL